MPDNFGSYRSGLSSPAEDGFAITPNDGADLPRVTRAIYVGGAGNIALVTAKGTTLTFVGVAVGQVLSVRASRVNLTNTTATNLIGLD